MNLLSEKILKTQKAIKTFQDFLSDEKVKNDSYSKEIALHWKEIEKFLEDSKIVFEFEGYFKQPDSNDVKTETPNLRNITTGIYDFFNHNFNRTQNQDAWDRVDEYFERVRENHRDVENFYFRSYVDTYFTSAESFYDYFEFTTFTGQSLGNVNQRIKPDYLIDRIKLIFNTDKVMYSDNYHKHKKQNYPDHWFIEKDGSLGSNYEGYEAFEIVSPYTHIKDASKVLETFKKEIFDFFDGKTDETTGGHINITCSHDKLDFVKLILLANDHIWLKTFDRQFNTYCQSQYKQIVDKIKSFDSSFSFDFIVRRLEVDLEKYRSFNFLKTSPPTVEFRVPGDDYLSSKFEHTKKALSWFIFVIAIGMNETLFKQEYMSKVMRIYQKDRKTSKANVKYNPFIKRMIYSLKDNDEIKENLDGLFYEMFNFLIRNEGMKLSLNDYFSFEDYSFKKSSSPFKTITSEEYKTKFKKILYLYLTEEDDFIHLMIRYYLLGDIPETLAIIKNVFYPEQNKLDFELKNYEKTFKEDLSTAVSEFIRLCSILKFNWTLADFKHFSNKL